MQVASEEEIRAKIDSLRLHALACREQPWTVHHAETCEQIANIAEMCLENGAPVKAQAVLMSGGFDPCK